MIGSGIMVSIIILCLGIGLIKCFFNQKIKSGIALILFGCFVIFMFNNPKQFNFVGAKLNEWVWNSASIAEGEVFKNTNTNVNENLVPKIDTLKKGQDNSNDLGKVE